jgi:hypothetical protein
MYRTTLRHRNFLIIKTREEIFCLGSSPRTVRSSFEIIVITAYLRMRVSLRNFP